MGVFLKVSQYILKLIHAYSILICTESPDSITKTSLPVYIFKKKCVCVRRGADDTDGHEHYQKSLR